MSGNPCMHLSVEGTSWDAMFVPWHEVGVAFWAAYLQDGDTNTDLFLQMNSP